MATVIATFAPGPMVEFPGGTVLGGYRVSLVDALGAERQGQTYPSPPATHTFSSVSPGSHYTVRGVTLNASGAALDTKESAPFDVPGVIVQTFGPISVQVIPG